MPQLATQADGLIDTITSQKDALATLTQTVARGAPALRDAAENVLELNPATSTPLLTSNANDIGLSYNSAVLSVVDKTGQEQRGLTADYLDVGNAATGINEGGFYGNAATVGSYVTVGGGATTIDNGTVATGTVQAGNVTANRFDGTLWGAANGTSAYWATYCNAGVEMNAPRFNGAFWGAVNAPNVYCSGTITANGDLFAGNASVNAIGAGGVLINANGIDTFGRNLNAGNVGVAALDAGGVLINIGGIDTHGKNLLAGNTAVAALDAGGVLINTGGIDTHGKNLLAGNTSVAAISAGGVLINNNGIDTFGRNIFASNVYAFLHDGPPSERRLKRNITRVRESLLDVVTGAAVYDWQYKPDAVDDADPDEWHKGPMIDDMPAEVVTEAEHGKSFHLFPMIYYAWGAIGELAAKVDAQAAQITALTARLDALEGAA